MQDALLDTPLVVCQSACCISALIVLHTTSIMLHASQRQYLLLSKAAHTIALVAFKISFLPTAFNYCKPVGEHPTFEIYLLSTLQTIIFQYFNQNQLLNISNYQDHILMFLQNFGAKTVIIFSPSYYLVIQRKTDKNKI